MSYLVNVVNFALWMLGIKKMLTIIYRQRNIAMPVFRGIS